MISKIIAKFSKKLNPILAQNITTLDFTARTYNILRRAGIEVVGDLVQLSWKDVSGIRRSTRATCEEVVRVLDAVGLKLKEEQR